jgi:eukaryotic-like serine/threonine-protein kinase
MNAFPAAGDYYKAVQAPGRCFTVPKLQAAEFVWDSLGPTLARGSSAVVFQASVQGRPQALRCYIREDASSRDRYSALDTYLAGHDLSPYVSGTTWLDGAITVNRAPWPVLTMDWIDGRTLNEYVDFLVAGSNAAALTTLAGRWRELVALLQRSEFAHGDLQHGNVMVDQDGQLRLVDFDGVWIPQLAGQPPPTEYGHPNYQHPLHHNWDRWLDTFSALVIYLSLVALARDPGLWLALYNSKNLLFAKTDFFPPFTSEAWKQLAALRDPQVDELARKLQECCNPLWVSNRSLEATLEQPAASVLPPAPAGQPWWLQRPVPGAGTPAQGAPAPAPAPTPASPSRSWSPSAPPAGPPGGPLPAPPPLSAPLGMAGTGPMPQLSQTMMPPSDTIWWTRPPAQGSGPAPGQPGPGYRGSGYQGSAPAAPMPRGYGPHAPVPTPPGPAVPGPAAPATRTQAGPVVGAVALAVGILLLVIGAASHIGVVVIGGLVLGAWGMWRLVTATGRGGKPPG